MIQAKIIYEIFSNFTNYKIVIGGSNNPLDFKKGSVLITLINSNVLSNSNKDFKNLIDENQTTLINQYSLVKLNYQIDIYKINNNKLGIIEVNNEALNIQEYLKSFDTQEHLKEYGIEILPCYANIVCLTEFNEQKHLINRAFFEFSLIHKVQIQQKVDKIDKIKTNNTIIGG